MISLTVHVLVKSKQNALVNLSESVSCPLRIGAQRSQSLSATSIHISSCKEQDISITLQLKKCFAFV